MESGDGCFNQHNISQGTGKAQRGSVLVSLSLFTTNKIFAATVTVAMATVLRLHLSTKRAKQR